jgi:hypothetical protein
MKKRFTQPQIVFSLRQAESGTPIAEIIQKMEISEVAQRPGTMSRLRRNHFQGENAIQKSTRRGPKWLSVAIFGTLLYGTIQ